MNPAQGHRVATTATLAGFVLAIAGITGGAQTTPAHADSQPLQIAGAGSSYVQPLIEQMAQDLNAGASPVQIDYTGLESRGRSSYAAGTVDFAVSDIAFPPDELAALPANRKDFAYAPITAGPLAVAFNAKDATAEKKVLTELQLSPKTLEEIFTNKTSNGWQSDDIKSENGGSFPAYPISPYPVVRAGASSESWHITNLFAVKAPEQWRSYTTTEQVPDSATESFPASIGIISRDSSQAVIDYITAGNRNQNPGTLGYVAPAWANRAGLPMVKLLNKSGNYVAPTSDNTSKALAAATINPDHTLTPDLDAPDPNAYPLVLASYAIVPTKNLSADQARGLSTFLRRAASAAGQDTAVSLGYAPLPQALRDATLAVADQVDAAGIAATTTTTAPGGGGGGNVTTTTTTTGAAQAATTATTTTTIASNVADCTPSATPPCPPAVGTAVPTTAGPGTTGGTGDATGGGGGAPAGGSTSRSTGVRGSSSASASSLEDPLPLTGAAHAAQIALGGFLLAVGGQGWRWWIRRPRPAGDG